MLVDLGAEVIKVEPPAGDLTRFSAPRRNGLASYFVQQNVGKSNLSIDLATEAGAEIIRDLCNHVDVVVENYRPGVLDRLGLGPASLLERNPRAGHRLDLRIRPDGAVGEASRLRTGG